MNRTNISWTDWTSNPLYAISKATGKRGWWCSHASTGCIHCYSESLNKVYGNQVAYNSQNADQIEWVENDKEYALWDKLPQDAKCFPFDMIDLFHPSITDAQILRAFAEMAARPWAIFQVLTKRIERASQLLQNTIPPPNIWMGTSVENQQAADARIPWLLKTPAAVSFLSCEPLLGPIQFKDVPTFNRVILDLSRWWIICGGESGAHYRKMNLDDARSIRDQCKRAGVAFWFKQDSGTKSETNTTLDGVAYHEFPKTPPLALKPLKVKAGKAQPIQGVF